MAGSGEGEAPEEPSNRVWLYSLQDQWDIARESFVADRYYAVDEAFAIMRGEREKHFADPNYRYETAKVWKSAGTGLGLRFAKRMTEFTGKPIGLIHCAKGDTRMEEWVPDYAGHPYMALYKATLRRIRKVGRPIKGVLWAQGESDTFDGKAKLYAARMKQLVSALRHDLNQPDLPFFYSQIATFALQTEEELPDWNLIQETQRLLEPELAPGGMCPSIDLPSYDWGHLSTRSLKRFGDRFAKLVRRNLYGDTRYEIGPRPVAIERDPADPQALLIRYASVNGTLQPQDHIGGFTILKPGSNHNQVASAFVSPKSGDTVVVRTIRSIPPDCQLWYGKGLTPHCNLVDSEDMAAPAFGPWPVKLE